MPDDIQKTPQTTVQKTPAQPPVPQRIQAKPGEVKKESFWKRAGRAIFAETPKEVAWLVWNKVVHPAIQKLVVDSAQNAINAMVYGSGRMGNPNNPGVSHVSNASVYSGRVVDRMPPNAYNRANRYDRILEGCLFTNQEMPLSIIHQAMDWIRDYKFLSVETFNQMLPQEITFAVSYLDRDWGWYSLNENCVVPVPGGWTLDLPPAQYRR